MTDEDNKPTWNTTLAMVLGYNEMAKLAAGLGEKVYFRLMRDNALKIFVELGGNADVFTTEPAVITIPVGEGMPHIVFRERDVELMREYVREYDSREERV